MSTTTEPLPDYTATIAECGDPQPVVDELTEWLDGQSAPQILAWIEQPNEGEPEPAAEDEPDEVFNSEHLGGCLGDDRTETSGAEDA